MLLHAADARTPFTVGNIGNIHAANGDRAGFRLVQSEQQTEHRAFTGSGPARKGNLFSLFNRHGKVTQHRLFAVSKSHMGKHNISPCSTFSLLRDLPLRLRKKGIDPFNTRHCRLNGLYFHAQTLDRRKMRDI